MNEIFQNQRNFVITPPKHSFERTETHVPIHLLHTQAYCERQIYLEYVEGIQAPPLAEMIKGSERHDALEEAHIEKAEIELSVGDAFVKSEKEGITLISREVFVLGSATYGRIDEIIIEPERMIIIDDKPNLEK
jgi:CRISPR/Cas system-associated exonuclease Cas4 (RecB family)